ncbi:MAG: tetratricopeptide repeat protein, partial [Rhodospirillaceae bacterium]
MNLLRIGCGAAALAFGIVAGFVLFKGPFHGTGSADQAAFDLIMAGQPAAALDVYTEQLKRNPKDYMLYLRRGLTLRQMNRPEDALADLTNALRLSPPVMTADELGDRAQNSALPETHRLMMALELHTERANILEGLGRPHDALADLDAAVALDPRSLPIRRQRAVMRTFAGRINDAVDDFNTVLGRSKNLQDLIGRANAKYLGGDYAGAAADFGQAVKTNPEQGSTPVWLLKSQLRGHLAIPLKQFEGLPKSNPAWVGIDALLSDYTPAQIASQLAIGMAKDKSLACDGMVFLGEWLVIKTDGKNAPAIFEDALSLCHPGTMPHAVATLELRRLATAAATPAAPSTPTVPAILHKAPVEKSFPGI